MTAKTQDDNLFSLMSGFLSELEALRAGSRRSLLSTTIGGGNDE